MSNSVFSIDGKTYDVEVLSLKRKFSVLDSNKSSRSEAGNMIRSIIGTFYNYSIKINTDRISRNDYDLLYEIFSSPKESHTVVLPYGQKTVSQKMYVTSGEDDLIVDDKGNTWNGMTIEFVAMEPYRRA